MSNEHGIQQTDPDRSMAYTSATLNPNNACVKKRSKTQSPEENKTKKGKEAKPFTNIAEPQNVKNYTRR